MYNFVPTFDKLYSPWLYTDKRTCPSIYVCYTSFVLQSIHLLLYKGLVIISVMMITYWTVKTGLELTSWCLMPWVHDWNLASVCGLLGKNLLIEDFSRPTDILWRLKLVWHGATFALDSTYMLRKAGRFQVLPKHPMSESK